MTISLAELARIKMIRANVKNASDADKQWVIDIFARETPEAQRTAKQKKIFACAAHDGFVPKSK